MSSNVISSTLKTLRKEHGLTQVDLAMKSGVGLNFVRELEQGKATVRMDKVAQVFDLFGYELVPQKKVTLPLTEKPYKSPVLFPFFDGLIPEGWLLDVALRNADISELDRFSLLLLCCKDCIGAVSVIPIKEDGDE